MMPALISGLTPLARVPIDGGTFEMGSALIPYAQPVIQVTVSPFEISKTRVTIGQYGEYLEMIGRNRWTIAVEDPETGDFTVVGRGETPEEVHDGSKKILSTLSPGARLQLGGLMIFEVTHPAIPEDFRESLDQPVVKIDWWEMLAFAAAHGGDLPTEAEYQRVVRGRSGKDKYGTATGNSLRLPDGTALAQFDTDRTSLVTDFPPNSWGVHDASGNAFVWTKGRWKDSYRRVIRGGSYLNGERALLSDFRFHSRPTARETIIGGVVVWRS